MSVDHLRQAIRERRRQLGVGAQLRAAKRLVAAVTESPYYKRSRQVAIYLAVDGELDSRLLIKAIWRQRKQCLLPVLSNDETGQLVMYFGAYRPGSALRVNRFRIREPHVQPLIHPTAVDLVLVPLVAFDADCNRVGMGGGFYDRAFAFRQKKRGKPWLIGVAHRLQQVPELEPAPWDVALDGVIAC